jgi:iron complex outermembrane recepter protein
MTFQTKVARVRRALTGGVLVAFGAASLAAHAQQQTTAAAPEAAQAQQPVQEVVVTGTLIKRTDTETPSVVQVLSAADIQQSGYTNIAQILNNISANGANTLSQSFSQAFAAGASGISLRGLTVADTLVLIDGQRTVPYPLDDDNQRSFVDTSAIPYNAIDHIEVLKDSGSALYGADAISGVVNVVLKKTYVGADALAEYGESEHQDGNTVHAAFIMGTGQLSSDGYNAYLAVDFHTEDQVLASNRSGLWTTTNWTPYGGVDANPGASTAADPTIAFPSSTTGYLINPGATNASGAYLNGLPAETFLPGCNATAQASNLCEYHMPYTQIQPPTEEFNALSKITFKIGDNFEDSTQLSWFNSKAEQVAFNYTSTAYPVGLFNIVFTPADPTPRTVPSSPEVVTVPANYPGNPYGAPAPLVYNFAQLGEPTVTTDTNTYRFLTDLTGDVAGWDIDAAAGIMYSRMDYDLYGNIEWQQLQNALNNGFILGQTPNATGLFGPEETTNPTSTLDLINATASKDLFDLPGGPFSLGFGIHYHRKVIDETAPAAAAEGIETESGGPIYVIGTEQDYAGFAQIEALPLKGLELDGSLRFDHYDIFGNATTPKFEVKYQPLEMLALRGTWGRGFRAPSAAEGVESGELFGGGTYQDPILCKTPTSSGGVTPYGTFPSQCAIGITGVQVANPDLKPVTSNSYTGGFIFEPFRELFNVSVDYYHIKLENDIISAFEAGGFGDFSELVRGPQVSIPYCNIPTGCTSAQLTNALTPVGVALFALYPYLNAGQTTTSGVDIDMRSTVQFDNVGKFSFRASWTHLIDYSYFADGQNFELAGTHGPSGISGDTGNPKDRAVFTLDWDKGPWDVTGTLNYTSSFSILDPSAGETTCFIAAEEGFTSLYGERWTGDNAFIDSHCSVNAFIDVDLYTRYQLTKNFEVHVSVLNIFNKQPPLDLETYGGGAELAYDQSFDQIGAIGRFFTVGASYKF